ncbi:ExeA family protein [Chamaesiphon minutus]|uniref:Type II secretory pathway, component ExeA (Predicted ATPase) n=1 Tax=Chamaesiphon minutus (strain ATCC 27169 / PCC 6605) TaxID=1173020 RepID=K9UQN3_CHAP6|nr:AAA family ATPase [Chamaesiphon minutus]AFY96993.1 type II secretory pathway, component ExeA (predicted ATPase) [Chamaesiphon minutus PCC 6605]
MLTEVAIHFGLDKEFRQAGYHETAAQKQLLQDLKIAAQSGSLVALTGIIGSGKTTTLRRLFTVLMKENKILVSKSISIEKNRSTMTTLISALFYDLSTDDKEVKIPASGEKRERDLRDLIKKRKKPVVLFVDEAHDLHYSTLKGLKRLIEMVEDGGGLLSVLLAGHPKLKNDLRRPTMEEIGSRSTILTLEGMVGSQREYITWLIDVCGSEETKLSDVLTVEAVDILSERLRTPLQIQQHLMLAMEAAYQAGEKPVTGAIVESVLSKQIDDLEPKLTRHGYDLRGLADQFHAKPAEIKLFFRGQLDPARTKELTDQMLMAGLPI